MGLTKTHMALLTKARTAGASELGVSLDDSVCTYLVGVIAHDLDLAHHFPEIPESLPDFFKSHPLRELKINEVNFLRVFERLIQLRSDADSYFYCLAILHKARLKYERILEAQPFSTIEQVGPRGLLQYGALSSKGLATLLFWRKWLFDIDNRAGQETGYLFEPIIAYSIGGVPYSAKRSPIKRSGIGPLGRQVDCIVGQKAYEIKLRVTIAASGQGRWGEELNFPIDCKASGYIPVLLVLDSTPNPKLDELTRTFINADGEVYIGVNAWKHLETVAGFTMARFLEIYVHQPIQSLLSDVPEDLPKLSLEISENRLTIKVGEEIVLINRIGSTLIVDDDIDQPPDDIDQQIPGL